MDIAKRQSKSTVFRVYVYLKYLDLSIYCLSVKQLSVSYHRGIKNYMIIYGQAIGGAAGYDTVSVGAVKTLNALELGIALIDAVNALQRLLLVYHISLTAVIPGNDHISGLKLA